MWEMNIVMFEACGGPGALHVRRMGEGATCVRMMGRLRLGVDRKRRLIMGLVQWRATSRSCGVKRES